MQGKRNVGIASVLRRCAIGGVTIETRSAIGLKQGGQRIGGERRHAMTRTPPTPPVEMRHPGPRGPVVWRFTDWAAI